MERLADERRELYAELTHLRIDVDTGEVSAIVGRIEAWLRAVPDSVPDERSGT